MQRVRAKHGRLFCRKFVHRSGTTVIVVIENVTVPTYPDTPDDRKFLVSGRIDGKAVQQDEETRGSCTAGDPSGVED